MFRDFIAKYQSFIFSENIYDFSCVLIAL